MTKRLAIVALAAAAMSLQGSGRAAAAGSVERFAQEIVVPPGQRAADLVCFFCSIRVRGAVDGDVVTIGGGIEIDGELNGDAVAFGGGTRLGPRAKVGGEVVTIGGPFEQAAGSFVKEGVEFTPWAHVPGQRQIFPRGVVILLGLNVGLLGLAALLLRRRRVEVMAGAVRHHYVFIAVLGVAAFAVFLFLLMLANLAGRAQPVFALMVIGLYGATALAGGAGLSFQTGAAVPRAGSGGRRVLAGAILLALLQLIPVAGMAVFGILTILAPGIAILSGFGRAEDWLPRRFRSGRALVAGGGEQPAAGE